MRCCVANAAVNPFQLMMAAARAQQQQQHQQLQQQQAAAAAAAAGVFGLTLVQINAVHAVFGILHHFTTSSNLRQPIAFC